MIGVAKRDMLCAALVLLVLVAVGLMPMLLPGFARVQIAGVPLSMLAVFLATVGVLLLSLALAPSASASRPRSQREDKSA
jgi:hypothetical protein